MLTGHELGKAIEAAMRLKGVSPTEVAHHFGVRSPSVHGWLKTGRIGKDKLKELFDYFSEVVGPDHWGLKQQTHVSLIDATLPPTIGMKITSIPAIATPPPGSRVDVWETLADLPHGGAYVQVPHYDVEVSAGDGCQWVDHANNDPLVFRARWFQARGAKPEDCRAIYVRGDSMAPTLNDGDTVLIDVSRTQVRDDSIYALVYGGDLYIKRLFRIPGGGLELRSDNPRHLNREVTGGAMADVHVLGEMIWRAG
jgi:hypothetical protein